MIKNSRLKRRQRGSALIYFAVMLLLGSLTAITFAKYYKPQKDVQRNADLGSDIAEINKALTSFVSTNGRLPCPASPTLANTDILYGTEQRTIGSNGPVCSGQDVKTVNVSGQTYYIGFVPFASLNLDKKYAADPWGSKIEYIVSDAMMRNNTDSTTSNFYNSDGNIIVKNVKGNTLLSNASYALISRGPDKFGSYNINGGGRITYPPIGALDRQNLGCDVASNTCADQYYGNGFVYSQSDILDDVVYYADKSSIIGNCDDLSSGTSCNNRYNCTTFGTTGKNWGLSNTTSAITVSKSSIPSLTIPSSNVISNMGFVLNATIASILPSISTVQLVYDYATTDAPGTTKSVVIAYFSNDDLIGAFDQSYIGQTISIPFGTGSDIPKALRFVVDSGESSSFSMQLTNIAVTNSVPMKRNKLNYDIWEDVPCNTSGSGDSCDTNKGHYKSDNDDNEDHDDNGHKVSKCKDGACKYDSFYNMAPERLEDMLVFVSSSKGCSAKNAVDGSDHDKGKGNDKVCDDNCVTKHGYKSCVDDTTPDTCNIQSLGNASYPTNPTYHSMITTAEGYSNFGHYYGSRIYGYFTPSETAQYKFYIAANAIAELYMVSDPDDINETVTLVASRTNASTSRAWTASGGGQSALITLESGKSYFFSLMHYASTGSDNLALGCSKTNSSGTTSITVLGLGDDTTGCGGILSSAPLLTVDQQIDCRK